MRKIILIFTIFLASCVPVKREPILAFDLVKLRAIPTATLCQDYYTLSKQGQLTENSRKQFESVLIDNGVSTNGITNIRKNKIFIGMSQCGLYASWGRPRDENTSVNKYSKRIQHIYGSRKKPNYVYTENGKVTSW